MQTASLSRDSDWAGLGRGLRVSISNTVPGDIDAAGPGTMLGNCCVMPHSRGTQARCCWCLEEAFSDGWMGQGEGSLLARMGGLKLKGTILEAISGRGRIPELDFCMAKQEVSPDHVVDVY